MLGNIKTFEYYKSYSVIHSNPIFPLSALEQLFELFSIFASKEVFFKLKTDNLEDALEKGKQTEQIPLYLRGLIKKVGRKYPQGASFDQFVKEITEIVTKDKDNGQDKDYLTFLTET